MKILSIFTTETIKVQDVFGTFVNAVKTKTTMLFSLIQQATHKLLLIFQVITNRAPPVSTPERIART